MSSPSLTNEQAVCIIIVIRRATVLFLYSLSVRAVFVRCGNAALYYGSKIASVLPRKDVRTAVIVRKGKKSYSSCPFVIFNYSILIFLIFRFPNKGRTVDISSYECARFAAGFDITRESHTVWQYRKAPQKCDCACVVRVPLRVSSKLRDKIKLLPLGYRYNHTTHSEWITTHSLPCSSKYTVYLP